MKKRCRRIHRQGSPPHDEEVGPLQRFHRLLNGGAVQGFLVQHYIRLDDSAAAAPGNPLRLQDEPGVIPFPATGTIVAVYRPVELQHFSAARQLMQSIDVLGHHSQQFSRLLQFRQLFVGGVGFGIQIEHPAAVKGKELLRVFLVKVVAEYLLRRVTVPLLVKAVHAAEIWQARFRTPPCSAECDDPAACVNKFLQLLNSCHG